MAAQTRWTHLIRYSPTHTGYATLREQGGVHPFPRLLAVGDNVHAPGQTVAHYDAYHRRWLDKDNRELEVLVRPRRGQPATQPKPHRVVVWVDDRDEAGVAVSCIPWLRTGFGDMVSWEPAPFRPTCEDVTRRIEAAARHGDAYRA